MIDDVKFDEEESSGRLELPELNLDDIMKDVSFDEIENQDESPRKEFVFDTFEDKETKPTVSFGDEDIMKNVVGNDDDFDIDIEKEMLPENLDISPDEVNHQSGLDVLNLDDLDTSLQEHNDFQMAIEDERFSEDKLEQEGLTDFNFEMAENATDIMEADFLPQVSDVDVMTQEGENTGFADASDIEKADDFEELDSGNEDSLDDFNFDNIIQPTEQNADVADDAESWASSEEISEDIDSDGLGQELEEPIQEGEQSAVESYSQPTTQELEQAVANNVSWYSGTVKDKYFEVSLMVSSQDFFGDERCDAIYVNVGMDTYGWNAMFENGVFMNLRDLRTYQSRYGCLPDHQGLIMYGDLEFNFNNISRIVIYEAAEYFSYGIPTK